MTLVSHRTLDGRYALCSEPGSCELLFHFPNLTPQEVRGLPSPLLKMLIEVVDPPTEVSPDGVAAWKNASGQLHRDYDLPAVIWVHGGRAWYQHGLEHRDWDRPSIIFANGDKRWSWRGKLHRPGGKPALVQVNGSRDWYEYGQRHRVAGPAVIRSSLFESYWGGPEWHITAEWWLRDRELVSAEEYERLRAQLPERESLVLASYPWGLTSNPIHTTPAGAAFTR